MILPWQRQFCLAVCLFLLPTWSGLCSADSYDSYFYRSDARFLAWHSEGDWLWLKAQCRAESNLDPNALSPVGAMGLCQFMPMTFLECQMALNFRASAYSPKANVICAGWYMRRMLLFWHTERTFLNRYRWAWGSYNAGPGTLLKAQEKHDGALSFEDIKDSLPRETRDYVHRIEKFRGQAQ